MPPARCPGPREERHDRAGVADLVSEVEVIGLGIVEVDGLLDEPQAEHARVEGEGSARIAGDGGDVMNAEEGEPSHAASEIRRACALASGLTKEGRPRLRSSREVVAQRRWVGTL